MRADVDTIRTKLEDRYGVSLSVEERPCQEGQKIVIWSSDLPESHGVVLDIILGWRSLSVSASGGSYSREFVAAMSRAEPAERELFRSFLRTAIAKGATVCLSIDGSPRDFESEGIWSHTWNRFCVSIERHPFTSGGPSSSDVCARMTQWVSMVLGAVLSLVPLEEDDESARREGAIEEILSKRYERDPINRALCIEIHGASCMACEFDFSKVYGDIGDEFIEVHHVERLADNDGVGIAINPLTDLVPLCSNCHSMVHRRTPPYRADELREMMKPLNSPFLQVFRK
jgi:5-methylcytosine-specific restriction protein A